MPGSSLWLLPPPSHPLHTPLTKLITHSITSHFPHTSPPPFSAHITLTSEILASLHTHNPQAWLDSLSFPPRSSVRITFDRVRSEEVFFRRCYIRVRKDSEADEGLNALAKEARKVGVLGGDESRADEWVREAYMPHLSLMYADTKLSEEDVAAVEKIVLDAGVALGGKGGEMGGWQGGVVWLVPTDKSIAEWKPIATRVL